MNSKRFILSLVVLVILLAGVGGYLAFYQKDTTPILVPSSTTTPTKASEYPAWIQVLIVRENSGPVANPPASLTQYTYKGKTVYYLPPRCCDIPSVLYDDNGTVMCSPDGGFTGQGDGRCSDFFTARRGGTIIWRDSRR